MTLNLRQPLLRTARWTGLASCLLVAAAWLFTVPLLTNRASYAFYHSQFWFVGVGRGQLVYDRFGNLRRGLQFFSYTPPVWLPFTDRYALTWPSGFNTTYGSLSHFEVPLWLIFVACAIPTAWFWTRPRRDRQRDAATRCRNCNYNLTGNQSGKCPECGTPNFLAPPSQRPHGATQRRRSMSRTPILKQFSDLTPADFADHAVWVSVHTLDCGEPWYDGTDEATFRPWTGKLPVAPQDGMFLVRAKLTLADGRVLGGFVTSQSDAEPVDLGTIQPQIFLPSGQRSDFGDGMFKRDAKDRAPLYEELGNDHMAIFPINFAAEKGLAQGRIAGAIPGFCWRSGKNIEVYY